MLKCTQFEYYANPDSFFPHSQLFEEIIRFKYLFLQLFKLGCVEKMVVLL